MNVDAELDSWRHCWQTPPASIPDLKERVERETRRMRHLVAGEIIVAIVFGGGSLTWAVLSGRTDVLVLAAGVWAFIAVASTVSFVLRRDAWVPDTLTTAAFLELSILRCRRRRLALIAQAVLYVMILSFDLAWIYVAVPGRASAGVVSYLTSPSVAWVWGITVALGAAALKQRQRLASELDTLVGLRRQLEEAVTSAGQPPERR